MTALAPYLPQDRLRALASAQTLPDRATGSVLFADISGFTSLTEKLTQTRGPRRGIEELAHHINNVYARLIAHVEQLNGSVVSFAGDAITCWFDASAPDTLSSALRAIICGLNMQKAMTMFRNVALPETEGQHETLWLALKIAVATGPVRRFVVGDPDIQWLDTLAGNTLTRMANGGAIAQPGEIVVDEATLAHLSGRVLVKEWRTAPPSAENFAAISRLTTAAAVPPPLSTLPAINHELLRPWLLPAVYEREQAGLGTFLTELRAVVALFLGFEGIDYEEDEQAGEKLNQLACLVQKTVHQQGGTLLDLTIGDKGSSFYVAFGVPIAHEDDPHRSLRTALELQTLPAQLPFLKLVRMGISRGVMRTGAYGCVTRRTYGALGDEVNLASRLMQSAKPGQIIVSGRLQAVTTPTFAFEALPLLTIKGKAEPVTAFSLIPETPRQNFHLLDPHYSLPMTGRETEMAQIAQKMAQVQQGKGQVIGITGEAGIGKSRLVAEAITLAQQLGFTGYGSACRADGTSTPYLVWRAIWSHLLAIDMDAPAAKQLEALETGLRNLAPQRLSALPLVATLLGFSVPDNAFTHGLEPKNRKGALEVALVDCLRGASHVASHKGLFLLLEDLHWIDPLSLDLLVELVRVGASLPVLIVLTYRPPDRQNEGLSRIESLAHFTSLGLQGLTFDQAQQLIRARLAHLFPGPERDLPLPVMRQLIEKAQGNPFYLEELISYLHDTGFDFRQVKGVEPMTLPDSLHTLVLSRLDQLTEQEKTTLKVASVIGRVFRAIWLYSYYPALGLPAQVNGNLEHLHRLDITPLASNEPERTYLFKHIVIHEVTYESLSYATRAYLHEQLACFLESLPGEARHGWDASLDLLAFHYGRSDNREKQKLYFRLAGEVAQAAYDNLTALAHYRRLLPLLSEPQDKIALSLQCGTLLERIGQWQEAENEYLLALDLSQQHALRLETAHCQKALGALSRSRGHYESALMWLEQALAQIREQGNPLVQGQVLIEIGMVYQRQGDSVLARRYSEEGLALAQQEGDRPAAAKALNNLGNVADTLGESALAQEYYQTSLLLREQLGDKQGIAASLNNLGNLARREGNFLTARELYQTSLNRLREIGDKPGIAILLGNLGATIPNLGEYEKAQTLHEECLVLNREIGSKTGIAISLSNLGSVAFNLGNYDVARTYLDEALVLQREMGEKRSLALTLCNLGMVTTSQEGSATGLALHKESLKIRWDVGDRSGQTYDLLGLAFAAAKEGDLARAVYLVASAKTLADELNFTWEKTEQNIYTQLLASTRRHLGEAEFLRLWQSGETTPVDKVVSFVLEQRPTEGL